MQQQSITGSTSIAFKSIPDTWDVPCSVQPERIVGHLLHSVELQHAHCFVILNFYPAKAERYGYTPAMLKRLTIARDYLLARYMALPF